MAGSQRILLVEDNPQIIDLYTTVLKNAGFTVDLAGTVDEALEKAKQLQPDLILLDIMLPGGKTGLEALKILRTDPSYGCTNKHMIVLTNLGLTDEIEKECRQYADSYLIKADIVPHDLLRIVKATLS